MTLFVNYCANTVRKVITLKLVPLTAEKWEKTYPLFLMRSFSCDEYRVCEQIDQFECGLMESSGHSSREL